MRIYHYFVLSVGCLVFAMSGYAESHKSASRSTGAIHITITNQNTTVGAFTLMGVVYNVGTLAPALPVFFSTLNQEYTGKLTYSTHPSFSGGTLEITYVTANQGYACTFIINYNARGIAPPGSVGAYPPTYCMVNHNDITNTVHFTIPIPNTSSFHPLFSLY